MVRHKYYVICYVECPECDGTNRIIGRDSDGEWEDRCDACNEQGEVEVRVPLVEALRELGVGGVYVE